MMKNKLPKEPPKETLPWSFIKTSQQVLEKQKSQPPQPLTVDTTTTDNLIEAEPDISMIIPR